jgi:hypothetical protein
MYVAVTMLDICLNLFQLVLCCAFVCERYEQSVNVTEWQIRLHTSERYLCEEVTMYFMLPLLVTNCRMTEQCVNVSG